MHTIIWLHIYLHLNLVDKEAQKELVLKVAYVYLLWENTTNIGPVNVSFPIYDEILGN